MKELPHAYTLSPEALESRHSDLRALVSRVVERQVSEDRFTVRFDGSDDRAMPRSTAHASLVCRSDRVCRGQLHTPRRCVDPTAHTAVNCTRLDGVSI